MKKSRIIWMSAVVLLSACSTEVDLNAPY
ncbi:MAG: hypothetical protein RL220_1564, partial [Bacteroidota bacterium]